MPQAAKKTLSLWAPVVFYMALIYVLSSYSFSFSMFRTAQKNHADWLIHSVEYGVLGYLLSRALGSEGKYHGAKLWLWVLFLGVSYGIADEWHQRFVPMRDASLYDVIADSIGVALGTWAWVRQQRKQYAGN